MFGFSYVLKNWNYHLTLDSVYDNLITERLYITKQNHGNIFSRSGGFGANR